MKILQAKQGYIYVAKDKSQVYGKLVYTPDNFDNYMEVTDIEAEDIKKAIELKIQEEMKKHGLNA